MAILKLIVEGQTLKVESSIEKIVENSIDYLTYEVVSNDPDWNDINLGKKVVVQYDSISIEHYGTNGEIDPCVIAPPGFSIRVTGFEMEGEKTVKRITTDPVFVSVYPSGRLSGHNGDGIDGYADMLVDEVKTCNDNITVALEQFGVFKTEIDNNITKLKEDVNNQINQTKEDFGIQETIYIPPFNKIDNSIFSDNLIACAQSWFDAASRGDVVYHSFLGGEWKDVATRVNDIINPMLYNQFEVNASGDGITPTEETKNINNQEVKEKSHRDIWRAVRENPTAIKTTNCITLANLILMGTPYECSRFFREDNFLGAGGYGFNAPEMIRISEEKEASESKSGDLTDQKITYTVDAPINKDNAYKILLQKDFFFNFRKMGLGRRTPLFYVENERTPENPENLVYYDEIMPGDVLYTGGVRESTEGGHSTIVLKKEKVKLYSDESVEPEEAILFYYVHAATDSSVDYDDYPHDENGDVINDNTTQDNKTYMDSPHVSIQTFTVKGTGINATSSLRIKQVARPVLRYYKGGKEVVGADRMFNGFIGAIPKTADLNDFLTVGRYRRVVDKDCKLRNTPKKITGALCLTVTDLTSAASVLRSHNRNSIFKQTLETEGGTVYSRIIRVTRKKYEKPKNDEEDQEGQESQEDTTIYYTYDYKYSDWERVTANETFEALYPGVDLNDCLTPGRYRYFYDNYAYNVPKKQIFELEVREIIRRDEHYFKQTLEYVANGGTYERTITQTTRKNLNGETVPVIYYFDWQKAETKNYDPIQTISEMGVDVFKSRFSSKIEKFEPNDPDAYEYITIAYVNLQEMRGGKIETVYKVYIFFSKTLPYLDKKTKTKLCFNDAIYGYVDLPGALLSEENDQYRKVFGATHQEDSSDPSKSDDGPLIFPLWKERIKHHAYAISSLTKNEDADPYFTITDSRTFIGNYEEDKITRYNEMPNAVKDDFVFRNFGGTTTNTSQG